ncbi:calmodulin-beta-like [Dreissena polymorpha]|uniref:Sulfhydryl light chain n=1 Tax=Dreissena polymorpha TaxID=45954 RepID=A0A9D4BY50_DREPO|nr:calmodulin-beta-like [Dreissena polymorpha]KAH3713110.1 hypothetical protein DPMN_072876 [Dreissena polymorpha]
MAEKSASPKDRKQFEKDVKNMFDQMDKNGNGKVSKEEMGKLLRSMGVQMTGEELEAAMKKIDTNKDGQISYSEFKTFVMRQFHESSGSKEDQIRQVFRMIDRDDNGYIQKAEIRRAVKALGETLTNAELEDMMREADLNNDGKINYEEFVKMWTKKLEARATT